mgnify:CR=1 FL=1
MEQDNLIKSYYMAMLKCLSYVFVMVGVVTVLPAFMTFFYRDEEPYMWCFVFPGILYIFIGYFIHLCTEGYAVTNLKRNGGSLMVLLLWIVSILLGAIPFVLTKQYTFVQALFESTSGFTTTGFTVTDVANAPHIVLMYRSLLHLLGGVGLVLILSLILSKTFGMQFYMAEGHLDRLAPSLRNSARVIILIYLGFIIGGTILFIIFGMPAFDAVNHAISAVSTGGFSTKVESIGYWHSVPIDVTAVVLMIMGATNFMTSMLILKGKFRDALLNDETLITIFLIAIVSPIVIVQLLVNGVCQNTLSAIDNGIFQVVSLLTTTGLSTINDFLPNVTFAMAPILLLMIVGGNSGSTAGGIKAYRAAFGLKSIFYDARSEIEAGRIHRARFVYRFGKQDNIDATEQSKNHTYIVMYLLLGLLGTFGLTLCGYTFQASLIESFSALGTVGLSIGIVGPDMSNFAMFIIILEMIIARLEIYIVILGGARIVADIKELVAKMKK